jgi:hypothetical protein
MNEQLIKALIEALQEGRVKIFIEASPAATVVTPAAPVIPAAEPPKAKKAKKAKMSKAESAPVTPAESAPVTPAESAPVTPAEPVTREAVEARLKTILDRGDREGVKRCLAAVEAARLRDVPDWALPELDAAIDSLERSRGNG